MHMRKMQRGILTLMICLTFVLAATTAMAASYYVSTSGNDGNNGSSSAPWRSLSHATSVAKARGDVINVLAGDYTDNNTCTLAQGVSIKGAGSGKTIIRTSAGTYIKAENSGTPVVDGSNSVTGIRFIGSGSNTAISSVGRSNQTFSANSFESFGKPIVVHGKPYSWTGSCGGKKPGSTAAYCDDDARTSTQPADNEWARNIKINNNKVTNGLIQPSTIKDSEIGYNVIDNRATLKSCLGDLGMWWDNVDVHDNELYTQTISWNVIAIEAWMVQGNTKFRNNKTNGWFSIIKNPNGTKTPYSWQIVNNVFSSDAPVGVGSAGVRAAIESAFHVENVLIAGNYVENTGSNRTYQHAVGIWGYGINRNVHIRNNVFRNMRSDGIMVSATDTHAQLFDGDNIYVYNNVFDTCNNGSSQALYLEDGAGDIDNVFFKNNIVMNAATAVLVNANHSVSNVQVTHNLLQNAAATKDYGSGAFSSISSNYTGQAQFDMTGNKPYPFYKPASDKCNLVDKGTNVGMTFSGSAPDLGAYEYTTVAPPSNLRVVRATK